ncbi:hypothetical protein TS65_07415, partial [Aneurinibacillus migulanus]
TELLHETQYLLVIHPYAVILPQEQLELPVAIFSFVAMVHLANESHGLDIPIVLLSLQVYVVTTSRNTRKLHSGATWPGFAACSISLNRSFLPPASRFSNTFLASHSLASTAERTVLDLNIPFAFLVDPANQIHPVHGIFAIEDDKTLSNRYQLRRIGAEMPK